MKHKNKIKISTAFQVKLKLDDKEKIIFNSLQKSLDYRVNTDKSGICAYKFDILFTYFFVHNHLLGLVSHNAGL